MGATMGVVNGCAAVLSAFLILAVCVARGGAK
jgi:hypothetical protein